MTTPPAVHDGRSASQPGPADRRGYGGRLATVGYGLVCLHILCFGILLLVEPTLYQALMVEDGGVEDLTAVWFLLAGGTLFAGAIIGSGGRLARGIYILASIGLVFIAGEEIRWGQDIIGFGTPDFLNSIKRDDTLHFHLMTIPYTREVRITDVFDQLPFVAVIIAIAAFFCGKDRYHCILMPSLAMILAIIVAASYIYGLNTWAFYHRILLLLLLTCGAVISGRINLLVLIIPTALVVSGNAYVMQQIYLPIGKKPEVAEYLFGFICVWYAFEILLSQKRFAVPGKKLRPAVLKLSDLISPSRLGAAVCVLAIAVGIGLALLAHFSSAIRTSYFEANYFAPIADTEPLASSYFNIFSADGRLYYFKNNCTWADIVGVFYVHIYPAQASDLPAYRQQYGFGNLSFDFRKSGMLSDGQCAASVALPGYPIASAVAGQHLRNGTVLWETEFSLPSSAELPFYAPITDAELLTRAHFDIYGRDRNLYYIKENCAASDLDAVFFLHIYPVQASDLPARIQQYGFQNMDYSFASRGRRTGARCAAFIELPQYAIATIHTGQYLPDGTRLWEAKFAPPPAPQ